MRYIYLLVEEFKKGDKNKFLDILLKFDPLLNKLQRNSCYEDMKNELTLFLFILLDKIPIELVNLKNDRYIISYIAKSIKYQYIHINKIHQNKNNNTLYLNEDVFNIGYTEDLSNIILNDIIKSLTIKEQNVIKNIYLNNKSESEVGRKLGVSRQAIHKTHVRALNKIKKIYLK